ncbi:hypothetical protein PG984_007780 [Apiospora sp. TS-2023a]
MSIVGVFHPEKMYTSKSKWAERTRIIELVLARAPFSTSKAMIISGWHASKDDRKKHCTVDYTIRGDLEVDRTHVYEEHNIPLSHHWALPRQARRESRGSGLHAVDMGGWITVGPRGKITRT